MKTHCKMIITNNKKILKIFVITKLQNFVKEAAKALYLAS